MLPPGWTAQGATVRVPPSGLPDCRFEGRGDRDGNLRVTMGGMTWPFQDTGVPTGGGGFFGGIMNMLGGMATMGAAGEALPWQNAATFAQSWLFPRVHQAVPTAAIQRIDPRPDVEAMLLPKLAADAANRGMGGLQPELSVVEVLLRFTERGTTFLERSRVQTTRLKSGPMAWMTSMMPMTMWFGEVAFSYRAPQAQFAEAEATLRRIAESMRKNPAWEAAQLNADNARALAGQQQNMARQRQVSQTLSETSDVVSGAYWSKRQIEAQHHDARRAMDGAGGDTWQENWSNATLGWENRVDDNGNRYTVSAGHERLWRDNAGNLITGNGLTNPDPTWHELKKPGD